MVVNQILELNKVTVTYTVIKVQWLSKNTHLFTAPILSCYCSCHYLAVGHSNSFSQGNIITLQVFEAGRIKQKG